MPQLEVDTYSSQVFWLLFCISVIYVSLKYIFIPRIENSISARSSKIKSLLHESNKLRIESAAFNKKYTEEIKKIHLEAAALHKNAIDAFENDCTRQFNALAESQETQLLEFKKELSELKHSIDQQIAEEVKKLLALFIDKITGYSLHQKN
ncbi:MAG: hypothetical protein SFT93_01560 [Rickettsiaceae bacterium]|nr:hypothetical protein [Rickettsiaceae bacterium]